MTFGNDVWVLLWAFGDRYRLNVVKERFRLFVRPPALLLPSPRNSGWYGRRYHYANRPDPIRGGENDDPSHWQRMQRRQRKAVYSQWQENAALANADYPLNPPAHPFRECQIKPAVELERRESCLYIGDEISEMKMTSEIAVRLWIFAIMNAGPPRRYTASREKRRRVQPTPWPAALTD